MTGTSDRRGAGDGPLGVVADRLGALARRNVPLGPLTTYRVGGAARLLAEVADEAGLRRLAEAVAGTGVEVLVVGKGSNLLVADAGFDGLAVVLGAGFAAIDVASVPAPGSGEVAVRAGGAVAMPVLARTTAQAGLSGLEWAVGVPGSVGGAVRMNAGGHGSDVAATLGEVRLVDLATGEDGVMTAGQLELGYRRSALRPSQVVVTAGFGLVPGDPTASAATIAEIVRWRRANQPGGQNAGSVFANPPGDSAGRLVEAAGCRGMRRGSARVSPKHANFVQADPGGSADDVWALVELVRGRVEASSGVRLETELRLVGFDPPPSANTDAQVEVEG
jgi:UDP-N-acetylmuramate dehydrogenase